MISTARQKELFEQIHDQYYEGSTDQYALAYKETFVRKWILSHLNGSHSLIELASGIGSTASWLRQQTDGLEISGCDISERAAEDFRSLHNRPCYVADLTKPFDIGHKFDTVVITGGIHHLIADLNTAFENIRKLLNNGGRLIMTEPNADFMLQAARKLWYEIDKSNFDAANEEALSHDALFREHGNGFSLVGLKYYGGPAYFLLCLNWILRVPSSSKRWLAPPLMHIERLYSALPGRWPFASFMACWEKQ